MEFRRKLLVFLGPPGAGKGSLSQMFVKKYGALQLSTGNLCRKQVAEGTEIGKQIDFAMKSGTLVPDSVIIEMVIDWLETDAQDAEFVIFDGFPRTVAQVRAFVELLKERHAGLQLFIVRMDIAQDKLVTRLSSRVICSNRGCQAVYSECTKT